MPAIRSFYTDVIAKDVRFKFKAAVHDMDLLEPVMREAVQAIIAEAGKADIKLMAYETYRSKERQAMLFVNGATKLKNVGVHHYGLACDLVRDINGQPSWKGDFSFLGKLAAKHHLIWGGDWKGFPDLCHVQRIKVSDQPKLFAGTWYPDASYDALK